MNREAFKQYLADTYSAVPDYPFEEDFTSAVYRHPDNRKWFALVMEIPKSRLGYSESDPVDVVNLKCDPMMIGSVRKETGVYPAYHMNKAHWVTVLLSDADESLLKMLVDQSYELTAVKKRAKKRKDEA